MPPVEPFQDREGLATETPLPDSLSNLSTLPGVDPVEAISLVGDGQFADDPIKRDFRNFLFEVWVHLQLPDPTEIQYDIAFDLQHGPKRLVIEAFRGIGKSWITSAFVCWLLLRDPQLKILVVSASKQRADDWTTFTLRLIQEMEMLQHLVPGEKQRNSKIAFDVGPALNAHAPSVKSVGITGQIAGSRADVVIGDDIEVPKNSETQRMRDKLSEAIKEFDAVLTPKPQSRVIFLGTPQTEQSVYNVLPARGYVIHIWPARFPTAKEILLYGASLAKYIEEKVTADPSLVGRTTDPKRFSDIDLLEREASYGRSGFRLQFMLDTRLADADRYPLKLSDLIVMPLDKLRAPVQISWGASAELVLQDLPNVGFNGDRYYRPAWLSRDPQGNPQYSEYTGSIMFIDPSGRGKDECAYAVVKILNGVLYLVASGGYINGYEVATLEALAHIAKEHAVNLVLTEPNFGDGMFTQLLKPVMSRIYPVTVEDAERVQSQKEKRIIDTLEPVMNSHRLVVSQAVIEKDYASTQDMPQEDAQRYQLFYQLTRITKEKGALVRDDRLDALAGAVGYWVEAMARDHQKAEREHRAKLLNEELERFMQHTVGRDPFGGRRSQGWMQSR